MLHMNVYACVTRQWDIDLSSIGVLPLQDILCQSTMQHNESLCIWRGNIFIWIDLINKITGI